MNDQDWRQLLSVLPAEEEIAARAGQARRRALARREEPAPVGHGRFWAPALAASVGLVAGAAWITNAWRVDPLVWTPPAPRIAAADLRAPAVIEARTPARRRPARRTLARQRLEVHWVLSDGTRVQWTFDKKFNL